eukprot:m.236666 g.236666  ORF g.236666 m.236666 type:complete len:63 (+) comp16052_c0_seq16:2394-2582(+)
MMKAHIMNPFAALKALTDQIQFKRHSALSCQQKTCKCPSSSNKVTSNVPFRNFTNPFKEQLF